MSVDATLTIVVLRAQIEHMANTAHQAYHLDSNVSWRDCDRPFCADARAAVEAAS